MDGKKTNDKKRYKTLLHSLDFLTYEMFENLLRIVTGERSTVTPSEQAKTTAEEHKVFKSKFIHDILALKNAGYSLAAGENIVLDLKSALELMPRDRKRIDAYKSFTDYLNKEFDCNLYITSQKTKLKEDIQ